MFGKNRDRLPTTEMSRKVMAAILAQRAVAPLLSDESFSVEGTPIETWASMKSVRPRAGTASSDNEDPGDPPSQAAANHPPADTDPMPSPSRQSRNAEVNVALLPRLLAT